MENSILRKKTIAGAKWSVITEIASKLVSPITNMILARLLIPEAFGIVATITMIISFAEIFSDAGFQKYLIQKEFKDEKEKYNSATVAFWTNLVFSILLWVLISYFSDYIAALVGNASLGIVITIACIQLPISSLASIQMAIYKRDFDFKTLFYIRIISIAIPFLITVPLALMGLSYWSLIIGSISAQLSNVIILTIKSKWKPSFFFDFKLFKDMFSFSIWSSVEAISIWMTSWIDTFIISSFLSTRELGIYKTSTTTVNSFMSLITTATIPVMFSSLSRLQNNEEEFNLVFFRIQKLVAILILPLGVGIYLYSDIVTNILLGNQWKEASDVIGQWALTSSIIIVFGHYSSEVYRAKGLPKISFLAQIMHLVVLIPVCIIAVQHGFWALVTARAWIRLQSVVVHFILLKFVIGMPILKMLNNIYPAFLAALIMGAGGYWLKEINEDLMWTLFSIFFCIIIYIAVLLFFPNNRKEFNIIMNLFLDKKKKNHE